MSPRKLFPPEVSKSARTLMSGLCLNKVLAQESAMATLGRVMLGHRGMSEQVCFLPDISVLHHFTSCRVIFQGQMSVGGATGEEERGKGVS